MQSLVSKRSQTILAMAVCALILKVTAVVVMNYRDYLPPNFESDFLQDRSAYFWDGYHWAFYTHIVAGPWTLIAGMVLLRISPEITSRFPSPCLTRSRRRWCFECVQASETRAPSASGQTRNLFQDYSLATASADGIRHGIAISDEFKERLFC